MRKLRIALMAAAGLAGMSAIQGYTPAQQNTDGLARIEDANVSYREPGEFLDGTTPVNGPIGELRQEKPFWIMERLVTRGEYDRCVAARDCKPLDKITPAERPAVGLSYYDAIAYAKWLTRSTGENWRLPTDREWALAAGARYRDDAWTEVSDPANPSRRWIAIYDAESTTQKSVEPDPQPVGAFGKNEHGLLDVSGNVWEWTSTCYVRHRIDTGKEIENCGVRIAEGNHRAYMTAFFRDPKAGACSVGIPPANLGLRLVRDEGGLLEWLGF